MIKRMSGCLCCLLLCCFALTQTSGQPASKITDAEFDGVRGSPFLSDDWADGVVRFTSGRVVNQFKIKFDCARNRLMLQFGGSSFATESKISSFTVFTKNKDSMVFRKGFPKVDDSNEETFYQVLLQGKTTLLRLFQKNIVEEKDLLASSKRRYFEEDEVFYLLKEGSMIRLQEDKNNVVQSFPDKAPVLQEFITAQQLKMKSAGDFIKLAGKYNELLAQQ